MDLLMVLACGHLYLPFSYFLLSGITETQNFFIIETQRAPRLIFYFPEAQRSLRQG